jgi:outer membrane protein OmpA-like peptidoglycan-associated protein
MKFVRLAFVRLVLIAAAGSFLALPGCSAKRHEYDRDLELATAAPTKLPPPSTWTAEPNSAPTSPTTITARASATNQTISAATLPAVVTAPQAAPAPDTTVVRFYPHSMNDGRPAAATASLPVPPDAFSPDVAAFDDAPRGGLPTDVEKAFGAPATVTPQVNANAAPTGTAVRAAAAAGARAFTSEPSPPATVVRTAQPLSVSYEKRGIVLELDDDALFAPRQTSLSPAANQSLDEVSRFLAGYPGRAVIVESHTDSAGTAPDASQLTQNRAEIIRAALLAHGVGAGSITARGYGESYPVASNASEKGRAENRRTEIVLLPPGQTGPRYREMFETSAGDLLETQPRQAPGALDLGTDRNM